LRKSYASPGSPYHLRGFAAIFPNPVSHLLMQAAAKPHELSNTSGKAELFRK
jgi:hypothetical protein